MAAVESTLKSLKNERSSGVRGTHTAPNRFVPRSLSEPSVITTDSSEGSYLARGNAVFSSFPGLLEAGRVYLYVCVFLRLFFVRFALLLVDARIDDGKLC